MFRFILGQNDFGGAGVTYKGSRVGFMDNAMKALKLLVVISAVVMALAGSRASAQDFPSKPIKIIVPFAAGGITDFLGRLAAEGIASATGQQVTVENRSGAGGTMGMEAVARSVPDGYTLALASAGDIIVNRFLHKQSIDPLTELVPIAMVADAPQLLVINSQIPASTLKEFIAYGRKNSGKITYGSAGIGTTMHLGAHLFSRLAGVDMVHVPYRGATPALTDMLGGRIDMMHISLQPIRPHVDSGKLRILAAALPERWSDYLPEVPTAAEAGLPGYEMELWFGLVAPRATPQPIADKLNKYMRGLVTAPAGRKRIVGSFLRPAPAMNTAEFREFVLQDVTKWKNIVRDTDIAVR
jgi:tripartite-type tricarboxylate transporter receptor subunit TctC